MLIYRILMMVIKTLYFNFKCFDFKTALKMPVIINYNIKIIGVNKKNFIINSDIKQRFMIKIGFNGSFFINKSTSSLAIQNNGKIILNGSAIFGEGVNIYVNGGILNIGENFYANRNLLIQCENKIVIGKNCLVGWNVQLRDTNGDHKVIKNNKENKAKGNIIIFNNVWIASDVLMLAESIIGENNIVATRSMVKNISSSNNKLIAGSPANVKDGCYSWEK